MKKLMAGAISGAAFALLSSQAYAITADAQIIGTFSNPVYAGFNLNNPNVGDRSFVDNTATAPATTFFGDGYLQWGTNPGTTVGTDYSLLTFTGAIVPLVDTTTPIQLGTITYTNGTSGTGSLIFGATLTFSLNGIVLGSDQVIINTTLNQSSGVDLTLDEATLDADYINICGNSSNICSTGLQAFENTEGMGGVPFSNPLVVGLNGTYFLDPGVDLTSADYVSGDGVVTERINGAPELSTWAMAALGFAALALVGARGARKSALT